MSLCLDVCASKHVASPTAGVSWLQSATRRGCVTVPLPLAVRVRHLGDVSGWQTMSHNGFHVYMDDQ